ncbi:DNA-3-methyladenine glycosylase [Dermatophilaceae bacterium Soc4.6]
MPRAVGRRFFTQEVLAVAPALLGCTVSHAGVTVRLTEVEAYGGVGGDPGSHAFRGPTPRTAPMFDLGGVAYVYFTYGMHWCLNLVTGPAGRAEAVLLRAGEVVDGHDVADARRPGVRERDWCRGPARLASALAVDGRLSGLELGARRSGLVIRHRAQGEPVCVGTGPRVGVSGPGGEGASYPWRFWIEGEPTVSPYRPAKPRAARRPG